MKIIFLVLALLFIQSCAHSKSSLGKSSSDPFTEESSLMKKYSLKDLGSALNIMRVVSDQAKKKDNKEFCDLSLEQASLMSQQLRFMIEEKLEETTAPKNPPEDWRQCSELCNCYVYSRLYQDKNTYFNQKTKELTTPEAYECAKTAQWFCGSDLHQYLKSLSILPESDY